MTSFRSFTRAIVCAMGLSALSAQGAETTVAPLKAKSLSKLAFGPDGILFVGDSIGAKIYALDLGDRTPAATVKPLQVGDLEGKFAGMLGIDVRDVLIHDMAVNPVSKNTYLTVSRGRRSFSAEWQLPNDVASPSVLLRVTPAGDVQEVKLDRAKYSSVDITNPMNETREYDWKKSKQRADVISDMKYADGKLYVAGLSNEEFSSTMRIFSFPFRDSASATSLEIYHGSHGKYETDSPVRAFLPVMIHGKRHLLASYLCTPLVIFPMDELSDKKHVKGTTIAELGSGNYPLDMVALKLKGKDVIMVVNSARGILLVAADDLQKPLPSITTPIEDTAGIPFQRLRNRGILQAENYGEKQLLLLVRNPFNGEVSLTTVPTEVS